VNRWIIVVLGLVVINAIAGDILIAFLWKRPIATNTQVQTNNYIYPTPSTSSGLEPTATPTKIVTEIKKVKSTTFIPIPGSGETLENKWTDIAGTEFNLITTDYPNLKEAYLEVNMRLFNGNGIAYVRLFDVTAGIEVWGSEVQTSSQSFTAVTSNRLTLRPGNHLYRVQAKSLTADTVVYNSGRIRIINE
jgi:hypothetical protein